VNICAAARDSPDGAEREKKTKGERMGKPDPQDDSYAFLTETVRHSTGKRMLTVSAVLLVLAGFLFGLAVSRVFENTAGGPGGGNSGNLCVRNGGSALCAGCASGTESDGTTAENCLGSSVLPSVRTERLTKAAEKAQRSVVRVTALKTAEDWFSVNHETDRNTSGLIVAQTDDAVRILTDRDIVKGMHTVYVTFRDGRMAKAGRIRSCGPTDLAVIEVKKKDLKAATRRNLVTAELSVSDALASGDSIVAIGSPLGYSDSVAFGELTSVTADAQAVDGEYRLYVTSIIGSGDSSGVLADRDGQIVGCISRKYTAEGVQVVTAVRMADLIDTIRKLTDNEPVGYTGITGESVTRDVSETVGVPEGVFVRSVESDSPALEAGIAKGDVITAFDGADVRSMAQIRDSILRHSAGDAVKARVLRRGVDGYVPFTFTIKIGENH